MMHSSKVDEIFPLLVVFQEHFWTASPKWTGT